MSKFDQLYRRFLITKFFTKGWGKPDNLKRLFEFRQMISNRESCQSLVSPDYPVFIDKEYVQGNIRTLEGHFVSPFSRCLPGVMPKEVVMAKFQVILPKTWKTNLRPVCLHLAGTGDHYFWRRRTLIAKPLLKEAGIGSIILENPYYGERKPKQQLRSSLHNVSDLFVMGGALVLESLALFHWCERQGFGPLGITGISMGGHGVMSGAIPWDVLQTQYFENSVYEKELRKLMVSPEDEDMGAYELGQKFVQSYSASVGSMGLSEDIRRLKTNSYDSVSGHQLTSDQNAQTTIYNSLPLEGRPQGHYRARNQRFENSAKTVLMSLAKHAYLAGHKRPTDNRPLQKKALPNEALEFMRGVMDEFTHLSNFSMPIDTSLIIIVAAEKDAYIPRDRVRSLEKIWPGAEVRYVDTGHVAAFLFKQDVFRKAICDTFQRQTQKYYR